MGWVTDFEASRYSWKATKSLAARELSERADRSLVVEMAASDQ